MRFRRFGRDAVAVVWLAVVWVLLWGSVRPVTVLGGVLVGVLVTAGVRLPPSPERLPVRPLRLLILIAYVLADIASSTVDVAWQVLRHGRRARAAVVAMPLLSGSDTVVTTIANAIALTPGSTVVRLDRERGQCYVYVLGPRDRAGVERSRRELMGTQRLVLAALGSAEEITACERWLKEAR